MRRKVATKPLQPGGQNEGILWVNALIRAGRLEDALVAAGKIYGTRNRAFALARIATAFEKSGQHKKAKDVASKASAEMEKFEQDWERYMSKRSKGLMTPHQARAGMNLALSAGDYWQMLAALVETFASIGDTAKAQKLAEKVVFDKLEISDGVVFMLKNGSGGGEKPSSYSAHSVYYAEILSFAGFKEKAEEAAHYGLQAADVIPDPSERTAALASSVDALVRVGDTESAQKAADLSLDLAGHNVSALTSTESALSTVNHTQLLCQKTSGWDIAAGSHEVAAYLAAHEVNNLLKLEAVLRDAGCISKAEEAANTALLVAEQVPLLNQKALAFALVAQTLAMEKRASDAWNILRRALALAQSISGDSDMSTFYLAVSRTYSYLHRFKEARLAADANRCPLAEYRLAAYTSLLDEYERSKNHAP